MKAKVEKTVNNEAIVVSLIGEAINIELFGKLNIEDIERDVLIFDLAKCDYISSSVLGWMVGVRSSLIMQNKREPIVTGANEKILSLFEITGVINLFKFV